MALSTLALGAASALQQSLPAGSAHSQAAQLAPQTVLIFGGVGSALVAVAYGPASTALKTWAQRLCDELFPLQEADTAAVIGVLSRSLPTRARSRGLEPRRCIRRRTGYRWCRVWRKWKYPSRTTTRLVKWGLRKNWGRDG